MRSLKKLRGAVIRGGTADAKRVSIFQSAARLLIDQPASLPDEFEPEIRPDLSRWCRVIRRGKTDVADEYIVGPRRDTADAAWNEA